MPTTMLESCGTAEEEWQRKRRKIDQTARKSELVLYHREGALSGRNVKCCDFLCWVRWGVWARRREGRRAVARAETDGVDTVDDTDRVDTVDGAVGQGVSVLGQRAPPRDRGAVPDRDGRDAQCVILLDSPSSPA